MAENNNTNGCETEVDIHIDLYQKKLSKAEWDYMEIPESKDEVEILNLIKRGFSDVNIKYNTAKSIIGILKTSTTEEVMVFLYNKYFKKKIYISTNKKHLIKLWKVFLSVKKSGMYVHNLQMNIMYGRWMSC